MRYCFVGNYKDKVSESDFVVGEIVFVGFFEIFIEYFNGVFDCLFIVVEGRLDMFWVFVYELGMLIIVYVLFGCLKLYLCEF